MINRKIFLFALVSLILTTACTSDDDSSTPSGKKHTRDEILASWTVAVPGPVTPDQIDWVVEDSTINLLSTMSMIVLPTGIAEDSITTDDKLAVFAGNQCLGVAKSVATSYGKRFIINIYKPHDDNAKLTVAYYNALNSRAYYWQSSLFYFEDAILGHVNDPYVFDLGEASDYQYKYKVDYFAAANISANMTTNDIVGIFVDDECRGIIPVSQMSMQNKCGYVDIGLCRSDEKICVRHFCSANGFVYRTEEYDVDVVKQNSVIRPQTMEEEN